VSRNIPIAKGVALVFAAALGATLRDDPNRDALIVIEQLRTGRVPAPYLQPLVLWGS
jgi:predicted dienelactone hydrolase